jgi:hypothetical protein
MVPDTPDVEALFGKEGVAKGLKSGIPSSST